MTVPVRHGLVASGQKDIIHQYANPNTAFGSLQQMQAQQLAALVSVNKVVLDIDGLLGLIDEENAPVQCVHVAGYREEQRLTALCRSRCLCREVMQGPGSCWWQRMLLYFFHVGM